MSERLAGALFALFYLSGRFSLAGSTNGTSDLSLYDVRVWTLPALVAVALTCRTPKSRRPLKQLSQLRADVSVQRFISSPLAAGAALLLPLYVIASICWTIDVGLATEKSLEIVILAIACLSILPYWRARRVPVVRHWFWIWMVVATGLMCLISCYFVDSTRMAVLGGGPNTFGRNMGLLFLGTLYLQRRHPLVSWFWYPLLAVALLMVVLSGSRGALLATSVGALVYFLIDNRFRTRNIMAVGSLMILVQVVVLTTEMGDHAMEMFQTRILNLTFEQQYMSGREGLYQDAYDLGLESPVFGQGLSAFKILFGVNYQHNLVLELFCETGAVGVSLLAVMLMAALIYVVRNRRHCDPTVWGAFSLMFTSSMFSGDLYDSRGVFLMALLASQEIVTVLARKPMPASSLAIARIGPAIYSARPARS
jgi:hypothetical protein